MDSIDPFWADASASFAKWSPVILDPMLASPIIPGFLEFVRHECPAHSPSVVCISSEKSIARAE